MNVIYRSPGGTPFPVEWPDEAHAKSRWRWDQVHNPTPLTPLAQDLIAIKREGMYRGGELTGRPFNEERMYAHGYGFARSLEIDQADAEFARMVSEQDSQRRIDRLVELWESSYRPETEALTGFLLNWASPGDSLGDLLGRYDQVEAAWRRCGELHTLSTGLAGIAMRQFDEFCREQFGEEGTRIAVESTSGMPNMSIESGKALWDLSRELLPRPAVLRLLNSPKRIRDLEDLDGVDGGADFRSLLERYLADWGQRNESYYEVGLETWQEDPTFVLDALRAYAASPAERSPAALHRRAVDSRAARTEFARGRLGGSPAWDEFQLRQRRAQQHTVLMEDHNYYIDQRAYTSLRVPHQAIGERLVRSGALDHRNDIFFLHVSEIREHASSPSRTYQDVVVDRKSRQRAWMHVLPPAYIGDDAPVMTDQKPRPVEVLDNQLVKGLPASAGHASGTARVILTLDDAHRLHPGEILVTYATAPPWTPLFAVASAVVTDAGGPLAHCAVVAREYGIPAIVGTGNATGVLRDGSAITVDGTSGVVASADPA